MYICPMKIPISLTYKFFSETTTIKKKVEDMHIGEVTDMYKSIMIPIFGEKAYEDSILSIAQKIHQKRIVNPKKSILDRLINKIMYY